MARPLPPLTRDDKWRTQAHDALQKLAQASDGPKSDCGCADCEAWRQSDRVLTLLDENAALREALAKLRNEVSGAVGISEPQLVVAIGHTNMTILKNRIDEADRVLWSRS